MVDSGASSDFEAFTVIMLISFIISGITYPILAYRLTMKHKQKIDNNFSYEEGINLSWLQNCIYTIGLVYLIASVVIVMRNGMDITFSFNVDYIFYSILILFIFYLGYFGIRHQDMFTNNTDTKIADIAKSQTEEKYKKSGLTDKTINELHNKLIALMNSDKPYLDPKVKLSGLADRLNVSPNQLSQVINQKEQVNFHDFINHYRTEEFIRRASENPNYSLLAHALDSGFNSKSSFNSVFKKQKGKTPSQFLASRG